MVVVGFCVFAALLIPLWIACFRYLWRKCDADSFIANDIVWNTGDADSTRLNRVHNEKN